jgi:hypothetical protein
MTEKCFDEGTIQAFLDGELAHEISQKVTRHIAVCDVCAFMLADAEEETAFAFSALEREFDTLVPTNRLWTKINDSIVEEKKQTSVWQRILSVVSVSLMSPSMAVAAGILIFVGVFAVVLRDNNVPDTNDVAEVETQTVLKNSLPDDFPVSNGGISETTQPSSVNVLDSIEKQDKKVYQAVKRETPRRIDTKTSVVETNYVETKRTGNSAATPAVIYSEYLPGEETYVKTIANLSETVETQKDTILRPSARISFERDLAVVDDAINKMKREVRKNPKNNSAKQVLYSSYQNKIDLLNSVAEKTELMASLK